MNLDFAGPTAAPERSISSAFWLDPQIWQDLCQSPSHSVLAKKTTIKKHVFRRLKTQPRVLKKSFKTVLAAHPKLRSMPQCCLAKTAVTFRSRPKIHSYEFS
jgi:hypothetical protein